MRSIRSTRGASLSGRRRPHSVLLWGLALVGTLTACGKGAEAPAAAAPSAADQAAAAAAVAAATRAPVASAKEIAGYLRDRVVKAQFVAALPKAPAAQEAAWAKAPETVVTVYRQRTVRLIDRDVNKALKTLGPRQASVRALYDATSLSVRVSWADETRNQLEYGASDHFGDAAALELPTQFGKGVALPHVGMGDDRHSVVVTVARARKEKAYARQFVAAGFGSLTRIDVNTTMRIAYDAGKKRWTAQFTRPLRDRNVDLRRGLVPFALALWDGHVRERGGNKAASSWSSIRLAKYPLDKDYLAYLAWGEGGVPVGDAKRGKTLMTPCTACHRVAGATLAQPGRAPGLDNVGGYGTAQYLRASIVTPNAVVVRQLNINRHYNKKGKRSARHAYPSNDAYRWYTGGHGKPRLSKMPAFAQLPIADIHDIVAYLKTLKTPPRAAPSAPGRPEADTAARAAPAAKAPAANAPAAKLPAPPDPSVRTQGGQP